MRALNPLQQTPKLQRHHVDPHADLFQVVLNQRGHLQPLGVVVARQDREFHRAPFGVKQRSLAIPGEAVRRQQLSRPFHRTGGRGDALIDPELVARRYRARQRHRAAQVDQADDGVAVDRGGNRLPEALAAQERLVRRDLRGSSGGQFGQVEKQKAVFQAVPGVHTVRNPGARDLSQGQRNYALPPG